MEEGDLMEEGEELPAYWRLRAGILLANRTLFAQPVRSNSGKKLPFWCQEGIQRGSKDRSDSWDRV